MNLDIENHIKNCSACLDFQQMQLKEKISHHEIPDKPWEVVGADMFTLHIRNYLLCSGLSQQVPSLQKMQDLSAGSLILTCKIIFSKYGLPKKIMSDASSNFILEKFKESAKTKNIEQTVSSYPHQAMDRWKHASNS